MIGAELERESGAAASRGGAVIGGRVDGKGWWW